MNRILHKCILFSFIILLVNIFNSQHCKATPPTLVAKLLVASGEPIKSKKDAISLLKRHKEQIINALSIHYSTFQINLPQPPQDWREYNIQINNLEFLFEDAIAQKYGNREQKIYVPAKGRLFKVLIPIVLKGSNYKEVNGKIIVREDKNIKEDSTLRDSNGRVISGNQIIEYIPVYATLGNLFVDEKGNIYY